MHAYVLPAAPSSARAARPAALAPASTSAPVACVRSYASSLAAAAQRVGGASTAATPSGRPWLSAPSCGWRGRSGSHVAAAGPVSAGGAKADEAAMLGVVVVDHGSRKKASNEMLVEFGGLFASVTGRHIVEVAHMEIAEPTIEQAIGRCAERGATTVVVAPYFLSRGRHIQEDIPALVAEAKLKYPQLKCIIADPIGIDPLMAQLINNRVEAALQDGVQKGQAALAVAASTVSSQAQ